MEAKVQGLPSWSLGLMSLIKISTTQEVVPSLGKWSTAVTGALHLVCPQKSTSVMDVPGDGETCEMECYVGKSVDETELGVSMSVTELLCISGKVNGVPCPIFGRQWSQWELY